MIERLFPAVEVSDGVLWFLIGSHAEYDKLKLTSKQLAFAKQKLDLSLQRTKQARLMKNYHGAAVPGVYFTAGAIKPEAALRGRKAGTD